MGDKARGIFRKFDVTRTDGTSAPGGKHEGCEYFVLDLTHDPHALPALAAYATACAKEYPLLAADLVRMLGARGYVLAIEVKGNNVGVEADGDCG